MANFGRYSMLTLEPIAWVLAANWFVETHPEEIEELIVKMSKFNPNLIEAFFRRMECLDFSPDVKKWVDYFFQRQPLDFFYSYIRSGWLDYFIPLAPLTVLNFVKSYLQISSDKYTPKFTWLLSKLAFHKECFNEAFKLLANCVINKNYSYSHEARSCVENLLYPINAATEADDESKIRVINELLEVNSKCAEYYFLVEIIGKVIFEDSYSRVVGPEFQGHGRALGNKNEAVNQGNGLWNNYLKYKKLLTNFLLKICASNHEQLFLAAKNTIIVKFQQILLYLDAEEVATFISTIKERGDRERMLIETLRSVDLRKSYDFSCYGKESIYWSKIVDLLQPRSISEKISFYLICDDIDSFIFLGKSDEWLEQKSFDLLNGNISLYRMRILKNIDAGTSQEDEDYEKFSNFCQKEFTRQIVESHEKFSEFLSCLPDIFAPYRGLVLFSNGERRIFPSSTKIRNFAECLGKSIIDNPIKVFLCLKKILKIINQGKFCNIEFAISFIQAIVSAWSNELYQFIAEIDNKYEKIKMKLFSLLFNSQRNAESNIKNVMDIIANPHISADSCIFLLKETALNFKDSDFNSLIDMIMTKEKGWEAVIELYRHHLYNNLRDIFSKKNATHLQFKNKIKKNILDFHLNIDLKEVGCNEQIFHSWLNVCLFFLKERYFAHQEMCDLIPVIFNKIFFENNGYANSYKEIFEFLIKNFTMEVIEYVYKQYQALDEFELITFTMERHSLFKNTVFIFQKNHQDLLKDFCKNEQNIACFFAKAGQIIKLDKNEDENENEEKYEWTNLGIFLLENFSNCNKLLQAVSCRILSHSHTGDFVAYLEKKRFLFTHINQHFAGNEVLIAWSQIQSNELESSISLAVLQKIEQENGILHRKRGLEISLEDLYSFCNSKKIKETNGYNSALQTQANAQRNINDNHFERLELISSEKTLSSKELKKTSIEFKASSVPYLRSNKKIKDREKLFNTSKDKQARIQLSLETVKLSSYVLANAFGKGDCFFDACAQALKSIGKVQENGKSYDVKSLRYVCYKYVLELDKKMNEKQISKKENWIYQELKSDNEYNNYIATICFTAEEAEQESNRLLTKGLATWSRLEVDGRIICEQLGISIHWIEILEKDESKQTNPQILHQLQRPNGKAQSLEHQFEINYQDETLIHLVVYKNHVVPLLKITPQVAALIDVLPISTQSPSSISSNSSTSLLVRCYELAKVNLQPRIDLNHANNLPRGAVGRKRSLTL